MREVQRGDLQSINARNRPSISGAYNIVDGAQEHECSDERLMALEVSGTSLERIERAIVKIQEGTYGECVECGCLIPVARLNAVPTTDTCVKCATEREQDVAGINSGDAARFALLTELEEIEKDIESNEDSDV
ncbi:hypothetical protein AUJ46_02225 [Candidatus Peregrinibacteria bacterium CG1_02_54_53]|nr:MAG: hypothetical protein AUJ46_02225 [Candidatus Peregrinibacteria bacterium CG1_02_54_53]